MGPIFTKKKKKSLDIGPIFTKKGLYLLLHVHLFQSTSYVNWRCC